MNPRNEGGLIPSRNHSTQDQRRKLTTGRWALGVLFVQLHGSRTRAGIYISDGVKTTTLAGGFVSGSHQAGLAIAGQDVTVTGMQFLSNSSDEFGGARGTCPGVIVGFSSRGVSVTGCRSGEAATADYQSYGCQVDTGADDFVITGNNFRNNVNPGVNNGAGTGPTKLIANNI